MGGVGEEGGGTVVSQHELHPLLLGWAEYAAGPEGQNARVARRGRGRLLVHDVDPWASKLWTAAVEIGDWERGISGGYVRRSPVWCAPAAMMGSRGRGGRWGWSDPRTGTATTVTAGVA